MNSDQESNASGLSFDHQDNSHNENKNDIELDDEEEEDDQHLEWNWSQNIIRKHTYFSKRI
jgi:hypothetical protein